MRGFVGPIRLAVVLIAFAAAGGVGIGAAAAASPAPPNRIGAVEWGAPRAQVTCTANVPTGVHFDFSYDASDLDRGGKAPYDPVADVELQPAGGAPAVQLGHEPVGVKAGRSGAYSKDFTLTAAPGADATVELSVYLPSDASYHFIDQQVALTCPPPSAARPVLPEVDLMLTGTGTATLPDSTSPWWSMRQGDATVDDGRLSHRQGRTATGRADSPRHLEERHRRQEQRGRMAFDVEVAFVGPARVDIGQVFNLAPLSCPPPHAALDSDQVVPGGTDRLSVRGFSPHQLINVTLHPAPVQTRADARHDQNRRNRHRPTHVYRPGQYRAGPLRRRRDQQRGQGRRSRPTGCCCARAANSSVTGRDGHTRGRTGGPGIRADSERRCDARPRPPASHDLLTDDGSRDAALGWTASTDRCAARFGAAAGVGMGGAAAATPAPPSKIALSRGMRRAPR